MSQYVPPAGFYFQVSITEDSDQPAAFQEVSGISMQMETETIQAAGETPFAHRIPGINKYPDLVLKRGLIEKSSTLSSWCFSILSGNMAQEINSKTLVVKLVDKNADQDTILQSWIFHNAYPTKWEVSSADSPGGEMTIESISFTYTYFEQETG